MQKLSVAFFFQNKEGCIYKHLTWHILHRAVLHLHAGDIMEAKRRL